MVVGGGGEEDGGLEGTDRQTGRGGQPARDQERDRLEERVSETGRRRSPLR